MSKFSRLSTIHSLLGHTWKEFLTFNQIMMFAMNYTGKFLISNGFPIPLILGSWRFISRIYSSITISYTRRTFRFRLGWTQKFLLRWIYKTVFFWFLVRVKSSPNTLCLNKTEVMFCGKADSRSKSHALILHLVCQH